MNPTLHPLQWQFLHLQLEGQRLRRGWTRGELARRARLSRTTLFYLEQGTQQPRLSTLQRLADTLDLDFETLISDSFASLPQTPPPPIPPITPPPENLGFPLPSESSEYDRETNPAVSQVLAESPEVFTEFSPADWQELYSCMGMGGALTPDGVRDQAAHITRKKQLLHKLEILLETHYSEVAATLLDALYQQIQIPSSSSASSSGWQPPLRQEPPAAHTPDFKNPLRITPR